MVRITIDGRALETAAGTSVAAAAWNAGVVSLRDAVAGEPRGALCAMGVCFECRVRIDGAWHQRACMELVREGMAIETGAERSKP
jgi:predicted molibdopterin-dependent oxidoreductase YjgC